MGGIMHQIGGQPDGSQAMFTAVPQADGSQAMVTAVPQVLVVSSPGAKGMQYAVPQMISPSNMQPVSYREHAPNDFCGDREPAPNDVEGKVPVRSCRECHREA